MVIFLKTKSDQNVHQNAPNCTILKNFLGAACPQTPPSKAHGLGAACRETTCKFPNLTKDHSWPSCQILATPLHVDQLQI